LLKYFSNKNIPEPEKEEPIETENISWEIISTNFKDKNDENDEQIKEKMNIRINNCFVNAKKEYLQKIKELWPEFIDKIENKILLNLLIDSNIAAASDKVIILTHKINGTVNLINENLDEIISEYNKKYNKDYKFIAITDEKWNKEREIYIQNIRNKHQYEYLDEPTPEKEEIEPKEMIMDDINLKEQAGLLKKDDIVLIAGGKYIPNNDKDMNKSIGGIYQI